MNDDDDMQVNAKVHFFCTQTHSLTHTHTVRAWACTHALNGAVATAVATHFPCECYGEESDNRKKQQWKIRRWKRKTSLENVAREVAPSPLYNHHVHLTEVESKVEVVLWLSSLSTVVVVIGIVFDWSRQIPINRQLGVKTWWAVVGRKRERERERLRVKWQNNVIVQNFTANQS